MRLALKTKKMKEEKQGKENEGKRQRVGVQIQDEKGEEEEEPPIVMEGYLKASWTDRIFLDRRLRFCVVMALAAMLAPCLVWIFLLQPEVEHETMFQTCKHYDEFRIPCFQEDQSEEACLQSHCCYNTETGECYHHFPSYYGMRFVKWSQDGNMVNEALSKGISLGPKTPRTPDEVELVNAIFTIRRKGELLQLQIRSESEPEPPQYDTGSLHPYNITLGEDFEVQISRSNETKKLLTTTMGPTLLGAAGRWDVVLQLPTNATILGAHAYDASVDDTWLYPAPGRPVASPTLLAVEESGRATAVRLLTSAPLRLRLTERNARANLLQIRLLVPHPEKLTIEMAIADTPAEVLRVLKETETLGEDVVEDTQPLPDWALGYIICPAQPPPEDITAIPDPDSACKRFKAFLDVAKEESLPWDAHCVEQSLLSDHGALGCLGKDDWAYIGERRLLAVLPNAIQQNSESEALHLPMMIEEELNETYIGTYNGMAVVFPDWLATDNHTLEQWVTQSIREAFGEEGLQRLGGVALIDNWPLDEGPRDTSSESVYKDVSAKDYAELDDLSKEQLFNLWENTLYGMSRHLDGSPHFNRHAMVPARQARISAAAAMQAAGASQTLVFTDAAGLGMGNVAGVTGGLTHGTDEPSWASLHAAAVAALSLVAAGSATLAAGDPICGGGTGFNPKNETHLELCERWYQQAATLPLMWAASQPPHRHLTELPSQTRIRATEAVRLRYELLPYLRGTVAAARVGGLPAARHLVLEFPHNEGARNASTNAPHAQWMLGAALLVAPAAAPKNATVQVFLPLVKEGNWRILYGGAEINTTNADKIYQNELNETIGHTVSVKLERTRPILLIRPGFIIPLTPAASAANATSTSEAVRGGLHLTASVSCTDECTAQGDLLLSTTDAKPLTLQLVATSNNITLSWNGSISGCATSQQDNYNGKAGESTDTAAYVLQELDVYGVPTNITSENSVSVWSSNGTLLQDFHSLLINGRLTLFSINLHFCTNDGMTAQW